MKAKKKALREKFLRAVRENEEQVETIQNLWIELKLPQNQLRGLMTGNGSNASPQKNAKNQHKIKRLEKILAEKVENYNNLKLQIEKYLIIARELEEKLQKNEREKEQILLSFQNNTDPGISDSTRLDAKINDLELQLSNMNEEKKQSQKKQNKLENELSNTQKRITFLQSAAKQNENDFRDSNQNVENQDLGEILRQKQSQVKMLREELAIAYKKIEREKQDAKDLRNIMKSDDSTHLSAIQSE